MGPSAGRIHFDRSAGAARSPRQRAQPGLGPWGAEHSAAPQLREDLLKGDAFAAGAHTVGPHFAPKAKNVIMLFMTGGPSQVDLWDPKPALMKYAGQRPATADLRTERTTAGLMPSRFEFARHGKAGIEMSELLPNLATVADELCVIRSMYTTNPNHEQAWCMFHQGSMILSRPSMGSSLSWGAAKCSAPQNPRVAQGQASRLRPK